MDLAAAAGAARLARVDYGPAMQLAVEDRSDAVQRDRRLRDRRKRADASVLEHGTQSSASQLERHALGIYYCDLMIGVPTLYRSPPMGPDHF